jgi:RNA-directed DNA polymerase
MPVCDGVTGRVGKATNQEPTMNVVWKSDERIVPKKQSNKDEPFCAPAEAVEGRRSTEGITQGTTVLRTQSRASASSGLTRVREAARQDKRARFTNLLHNVTIDLLSESF